MTPAFTIYCIRPNASDVGQLTTDLALRQRLEEALGPRVNVVWLRGICDGFGRSGLTSRTVYEINMFGHGLVVCGDTEAPAEPKEAVEVEAAGQLEVPMLMCGLVARSRTVAGLDPTQYEPLATRSTAVLGNEPGAVSLMRAAGGEAALGGPLALFSDRIEATPSEPSGALIAVRNPGHLPLEPERRGAVHGEVRALVDRLRAAGHDDVRLLCQDAADLSFAAAYSDLEYAYTTDPYQWLGLLRGAELVVSFRLEASLACAASSVPFIHLTADDGGRATLLALGLDPWTVELRDSVAAPIDVMEAIERLGEQAEHRIETMANWGNYDRRTGDAFARFATAVRDHRDASANTHRANAGLTAMPVTPLTPQETRIDLKLSDIEADGE